MGVSVPQTAPHLQRCLLGPCSTLAKPWHWPSVPGHSVSLLPQFLGASKGMQSILSGGLDVCWVRTRLLIKFLFHGKESTKHASASFSTLSVCLAHTLQGATARQKDWVSQSQPGMELGSSTGGLWAVFQMGVGTGFPFWLTSPPHPSSLLLYQLSCLYPGSPHLHFPAIPGGKGLDMKTALSWLSEKPSIRELGRPPKVE